MTKQLRLDLLGRPSVTLGGLPVSGFVSTKALALLAYLAVSPGSHSRASLATLLWGETPESDARASLRVVLSNLRQLIGQEHFDTSRATVALQRSSDDWLDVEQFEGLARLRTSHPEDAADALRAAIAQYRGDLLDGVTVNGAPAWDEWLVVQRERLRQTALESMYRLAVIDGASGRYEEGISCLTRLLDLDPWREDAHRQMMTLLVYSGQRGAALVHYERCRRDLAAELGILPERDSVDLYERIREGQFALRDVESASRIVTPRTSFVGREAELARIESSLSDPACRLLTLVGPGGIGKSRLAGQAAYRLGGRYPDGAVIVPLAPVDDPAFIVQAIAARLDIPLVGRSEPIYQLLREIRDRQMLLILDNVEHLIGGSSVLQEILDAAPCITMMVTSRERIGLDLEWLVSVRGLEVPGTSGVRSIMDASAVRLFYERALQVNPAFSVTAQNTDSLTRICSILDGMPLGIELAAGWTRTHSCAEIETAIAQGFDFLVTTGEHVPRRHQSLRAVFDRSWDLLSEHERRVCQSLSIFRGGFTSVAARAIAGASVTTLRELFDKSLIFREPDGRYMLHELVRRYAAEQLAASDDAAVGERHAAFFVDLVAAAAPAMKSARQAIALAEIDGEIENVRAAWQWIVGRRDDRQIVHAIEGFCLFYDLRGWLGEGWTVVEDTLVALRADVPHHDAPLRERVLSIGLLLGWQARFAEILGRFTASETLMQRSLSLLSSQDSTHLLAYRLDTQGMNANARGDQGAAIRLQRAALAESEAAGDRLGVSLALNRLGGIAFDTGRFPEAQHHFEQSQVVRREIGDWQGVARDFSNLGEVARLIGDFAEARRLLQTSVARFHELGSNWRMVLPLENLGELSLCCGQVDAAEQYFRDAIAIVDTLNEQRHLVIGTLGLGRVAMRRGELERARGLVMDSALRARANGIRQCLVQCRQVEATLALAIGDSDDTARVGRECLALAVELGNDYEVGRAEVVLGRAAAAAGRIEEAEHLLMTAFARLRESGARPAMLDAVSAHAELIALAGTSDQIDRALELLYFVSSHRSVWSETRESVDRQLAMLESGHPEASHTRARVRAEALTLELLVAETPRGLFTPPDTTFQQPIVP